MLSLTLVPLLPVLLPALIHLRGWASSFRPPGKLRPVVRLSVTYVEITHFRIVRRIVTGINYDKSSCWV
jgi:hypothetical protein